MNAASSDARNATTPAMSSTVACRRNGISETMRSRSSALRRSAHKPLVRGVSTTPGQMLFTVMPSGPYSIASWRVSDAMAPLAAA